MEGVDLSKIEGLDVDIEISLKEYGFAWVKKETETVFFYGMHHNGVEWDRFDHGSFSNDLDITKEFDWANLDAVSKFMDWENVPALTIEEKILALLSYYGWENVFGEAYYEGLTYEEIFD